MAGHKTVKPESEMDWRVCALPELDVYEKLEMGANLKQAMDSGSGEGFHCQ